MAKLKSTCRITDLTVGEWAVLKAAADSRYPVTLNGQTLTVAQVVAVSLYGTPSQLTKNAKVRRQVQDSVRFLEEQLSQGRTVYGVTTGFGGSADTRTSDVEKLQDGLVKMLNAGILLPSDKGLRSSKEDESITGLLASHALPTAIVKATMLVRCNSLLRGHSGVRMNVIETIMKMLDKDMVPVVPLRGSISASGDLGPLSYIAGAVQGNADIHISIGGSGGKPRTYSTAPEALRTAGVEPKRLRAKEGLGIVNGTSASCATAAIVIFRAKQLAMMMQILTAMGTEALSGTVHNYEAFISAIRPHPGQTEAAANIYNFLSGSQLSAHRDPGEEGLAQDRYSLRTAPQWIGPQLEDLLLAQQQIEIELNSTTDNPIIDIAGARIHHGGNFQAMSITSAMEKTILALQNFGRLLFSQCTELISNKFNNGLPPNLCADEPSLSYTFKGIDITMAAYMSELAALAHPISPHVVNAEMGNQALNSLALIAARRALDAVEVLSLMTAAYTYALCQAVDLRCLHMEFVKAVEPAAREVVRSIFGPALASAQELSDVENKSWGSLLDNWNKLTNLDVRPRGQETARKSIGDVVEALKKGRGSATLEMLEEYQTRSAETLSQVYDECRERFFLHQPTATYLGCGSKRVYTYVRNHVGAPFHRGLADQFSQEAKSNGVSMNGKAHGSSSCDGVGTNASKIYIAICNGQLPGHILESVDLF